MNPTITGTFNFHEDMVSDIELLTIEGALTYKSLGGDRYGFGESQEVLLFDHNADTGIVKIPRRYAFDCLSRSVLEQAEDNMSDGYPIKVVFDDAKQAGRPELKEKQDNVIDAFLTNLEALPTPMKGGILSAKCGTGKTVIASKLISIIGCTTLVLVHKEFLVEQWIERLLAFTDLTMDDIGIVQQSKCEYEGKKVAIAMVQSLMETGKYPEEFLSWAGCIISDEVHRMSAPCFQRAIPQFSARYRIGLTATARRGDGLQEVFEQHIGRVLAQMTGGNEIIPKIYQMPFKIWLPDDMYIWKKDGKIKKLFLAKLINALVVVDKRNRWLVAEMLRAAKSGRKVMLLSDRREHLDELRRIIEEHKAPFTVGLYVGGMKRADRDKSELCDIILGTFQMAKEGLDIPAIDTLYLGTPKSDVEQSVGRILRYDEDKKEPVVVDLVDTLPICLKFANSRLVQYRRLGYSVMASV